MNKADFQMKHSEIIGYYQLIEMRLKGICAALLADKDKTWYQWLDDYETDPLGKLLQEIRNAQSQKGLVIITADNFTALDELRTARNYWVHQCYHDILFTRDGKIKNPQNGIRLQNDLSSAIDWDRKLTELAAPYIRSFMP